MSLTRTGALAFLVVVGWISRSAPAQAYTFTKIVDTASTEFDPFGFGAPAINDAGQVAFKATDINTNVQSIQRGSGGTLTPIADNSGSLNFLGRLPSINNAGDVAFAITTSGNSPNVVRGLEAARERGLRTVALTGKDGGEAGRVAEIHINVPDDRTPRVQEVHIALIHALCEIVEGDLE